jgi:glycosyltransferase involved in cell wall biosynthesis
MPFRLGIGIITFNRKELVGSTIDRVRALTRESDTALVIADDGSSDGTLEMLREKQIPVVTGINMGIAWNKNRALFLLSHLLGCEAVILLEDDTQPSIAGWETQWVLAAQRWGHVNYAGEWMREHFVSGSGTADDPVESSMVTAQCAAYSRVALTYAGYFDPRFKGYGHEHVEHTRRLIRVGFGGSDGQHDGKERVLFKMIDSGITVLPTKSYFQADENERNLLLARQIMGNQDYRAPWGNDRELRQFRSEMDSAMRGGGDRFRLHGSPPQTVAGTPPPRGLFGRLLRLGRADRKR